MLKMTKGQMKFIWMFLLAFVAAAVSPFIPFFSLFHLYDVPTFLYAGIVIAWGFLVYRRIVNVKIRDYLTLASFFMLILFVSRLIRWNCFRYNAIASEYAWYAYYVSFTMVPLCAFLAALCVGKGEKSDTPMPAKCLWIVQFVFTGLAFTNSWHNLFFRYVDGAEEKYEYGPAYYVCVIWGAILGVSAFWIIVNRCRVAMAKKYWFIPAAGMLLGAVLCIWYYVCGGSPKIGNVKIFNLQEAFCLLFILPFESMIQLGILPNNSRYDLFFENSRLRASLQDVNDHVIVASQDYFKTDSADGSLRYNEKKVRGGKIAWYEDLTAILRIGEEIRQVTEEIEEENDLIRQENEIRAERIGYETQNRLYDKIAGAVREKAIAIDELLAKGEGPDLSQRVIKAMILGAYVKRMGNMMLITEEEKSISSRELGNAVRESMEYFKMTGVTQDFTERGECFLPARLVLLAYELFEKILESPSEIFSIIVWMDAREDFLLRIMLDSEALPIDGEWKKEEIETLNAKLEAKSADDVWRVSLSAKALAGKEETT